MESTSDTAERAADPTLLTIMVSAVPIIEFKICSSTTGTRRLRIIRLVNICCCSIVTSPASLIYDLTKQKKNVCILSITLSLTLYPFPALFPIYFLCFLYKLQNAASAKPAAVFLFCVFLLYNYVPKSLFFIFFDQTLMFLTGFIIVDPNKQDFTCVIQN